MLDAEGARIARARHAAAIAAAAAVALLALEFALRLASVGPFVGVPVATHIFEEYPLRQRDGYVTLRPGFWGHAWGFRFRVNRHGFRSPPVPVERRPDSLRILLLGSCITLGGFDRTEDGFSAFSSSLQSELQSRFPERRVEVLTAGVPGSFELQDLVYWQAELARFRPDIVVYESGTAQILEPGEMLKEYQARAPGATRPALVSRPRGLRERLYDVFDRSVVISHFYAFRRGKERLFRKHFFRRPPATTGGSRAADAYIAEVLEPGGEFYRHDLAQLYRALGSDGAAVVAYTFSHPLPDRAAEALSERDLELRGATELGLHMPAALDDRDVWRIFRHAYAQVTEINVQVAREQGVAYFDLQSQLRSPRHYDGYYYDLSNTSGSVRKGQLLARYILNHYDASHRRFDSAGWLEPPVAATLQRGL